MRAHVVLPDDLVGEMDRMVGKRGRSRFVAEAVRERLRKEKLLKAIHDGAGAIDLSRHPEWATPEKVVEWVRALRRIPSSYEKRRGRVSTGHERPD
ncbi:MAG: ribbon-helix-helix domain-containing protein [Chloroflexota bacterium]|nr:ribbon-helix-helix domain-containing protein [Chloroflexota bacterium]